MYIDRRATYTPSLSVALQPPLLLLLLLLISMCSLTFFVFSERSNLLLPSFKQHIKIKSQFNLMSFDHSTSWCVFSPSAPCFYICLFLWPTMINQEAGLDMSDDLKIKFVFAIAHFVNMKLDAIYHSKYTDYLIQP